MNIETIREYWDRQPCGVKRSTKTIGTKEYFDEVDANKRVVGRHVFEFTDFKQWRGKRVLEIGCGIGTDAVHFARCGAEYTGVDLSEVSLDLAKQRFEVYGLQGAFYRGNIECLSDFLPFDTYDLVYSFGVIHHTPQPDLVVANVRRYMHRDSEFRLMLYATNSWKGAMVRAGLDQPEAQSGCPLAKTYTHDEVRDLLHDFDIIDLHQDHIFPYKVSDYIDHRYCFEPWFQAMPPAMFRVLEREFGWHTLITCKLRSV